MGYSLNVPKVCAREINNLLHIPMHKTPPPMKPKKGNRDKK